MDSVTNNNIMESSGGDSFAENWIEARESASIVIPLHTAELNTLFNKTEIASQKTKANETTEANSCNVNSSVDANVAKSVDTSEQTSNTELRVLIVPVFCPLCCNYEVKEPVLLHSRNYDAIDNKWCVACKECVAHWLSVNRICNDNECNIRREEDLNTANTLCCPLCTERITFLESHITPDNYKNEDSNRKCPNRKETNRKNNNSRNSNSRSKNDTNGECVDENFPYLSTIWPEVTIEWMESKENTHELLSKLNNVSTNGDANRMQQSQHDNGVIAINTYGHNAHSQDCVCGVCEVNKATAHCRQCGFALCAECIDRTHTKGRFKEHELSSVSISDRSNRITVAPCKRHCVEHSDQTLELYCRMCQLPTCVHCCFAGPHRTHDVIPITEMSHHVEVELTRWQDSLMRMVNTAEHALDMSKHSILPAYQRAIEEVENEITSAFSTMHAILHDRERALCDELHKNSNLIKKEIGESVAGVGALHTTLHGVHSNIDSLRRVADIVSLIQSSVVIDNNCKYLTRVANSVLQKTDYLQSVLLRELVPPTRSRSTDLCASDNDKELQTTQNNVSGATDTKTNRNENNDESEKTTNSITPNALVSFTMSTENTTISLAECVEFFASLGDLHVASTLHNITNPEKCVLQEQPNESEQTEEFPEEQQQEQEKNQYYQEDMKFKREQQNSNYYSNKNNHTHLTSSDKSFTNVKCEHAADSSNWVATSSRYDNENSRKDVPLTSILPYEQEQQQQEQQEQSQKQHYQPKERLLFSAIDANATPSTLIKWQKGAHTFSTNGENNSSFEPKTQFSSKWLSRSVCTVASTRPQIWTERLAVSETNSNTNFTVEHGQKRQREQTAQGQHELQMQKKLILDL